MLERRELFPEVGVPLHSNRPLHQGVVALHRHDFIELSLVVAGAGIHRTIHGTALLAPGDVIAIHPGAWHGYERCADLRLANCCIGTDLLHGELSWIAHEPTVLPLLVERSSPKPLMRLNVASRERCLHLLGEIQIAQRLAPEQHRLELIGLLLRVLGLLGSQLPPSTQALHASHPAIRQAMDDMSQELARSWSLHDLAKQGALDRSYFVRLFRRHTGLSPMAWLAKARGERAAILLLTTDLPVATIGQQVGWGDSTYFARRFRALFRQTPGAYRKQVPATARVEQPAEWIQW